MSHPHHSDLLRHGPTVTMSVVQLASNLGDRDILDLRGVLVKSSAMSGSEFVLCPQ